MTRSRQHHQGVDAGFSYDALVTVKFALFKGVKCLTFQWKS